MEIAFSRPLTVIALSAIDGGFLHIILFEVVRKVNILIVSIFSHRVTFAINLSCGKYLSDMVYGRWYSSL